MKIYCPKCQSTDLTYRKKKQSYICEDCDYEFVAEKRSDKQRIFLSYGHDANEELVRLIKSGLEERGHDVWFDKDEIKSGQNWRHAITDGITKSERVLSFLSKHSTRDPGVCLDEIAIAIGVKGGNIQTILVEGEEEVKAPASINHIQWLDMHDWQSIKSGNQAEWQHWFESKFQEIVDVVESEESRSFAGEIEALRAHLNPIFSDSRISNLLKRGFVGREWIDEAVEKWRTASNRESRIFWLMGNPGVGKSAYAANLSHFGKDKVIAAQFVEYDKRDHRDASRVIRSLAYQLATRLPDYRKILLNLPEIGNLDPKDAAELFQYLLAEPLKQGIDGGMERYLIIIDALDEAKEEGGERNPLVEMLARHAPLLPDWLGLVVTSRNEKNVTDPLQGLQPYVLDTETEANQNDIRKYIDLELEAHLEGNTQKQEIIEQILENSEGVFLYVERVCRHVQEGVLLLDHIDDFPVGLGGIYHQFFQRQFPDAESYKRQIRPVLRLVLAAMEPLKIDLLRQIMKWGREEMNDFYRILGSLFPVATENGEKVIKPYHKSVIDWITGENTAGQYFVSIDEGHISLVDFGWTQYRTGTDNLDFYFVKWLPRHLVILERWNKVKELMSDFCFIQEKINSKLILQLIDDFKFILECSPNEGGKKTDPSVSNSLPEEKKPFFQLMSFILKQQHILNLYPELLFQQAANEPDSTGIPSLVNVRLSENTSRKWIRWITKPKSKSSRVLTIGRLPDPVSSCMFNPRKNLVVAGTGLGLTRHLNTANVSVWDVDTGAKIHNLCDEGGAWISKCIFSFDGELIIARGSYDKFRKYDSFVWVWDAVSGNLIHEFEKNNLPEVMDDGKLISVEKGLDDVTIFREINSGRVIGKINVTYVPRFVVSPNEQFIVIGASLWNLLSSKFVRSIGLGDYEENDSLVIFNTNSERLLYLGGKLRKIAFELIDTKSGETVATHVNVSNNPVSKSYEFGIFSPDGTRVIIWSFLYKEHRETESFGPGILLGNKFSNSGELQVLDSYTGKILNSIELEGQRNSIKISPDGKLILLTSKHELELIETKTLKIMLRIRPHGGVLNSVDFSHDGEYLVTAGGQAGTAKSEDNSFTIWSVCDLLNSPPEYSNSSISFTAFDPFSGSLIIGGKGFVDQRDFCGNEKEFLKFDTQIDSLGKIDNFSFHSIAFSPDGNHFVTAVSIERKIENLVVWERESKKIVKIIKGHKKPAKKCEYTPDGSHMISMSEDEIMVWKTGNYGLSWKVELRGSIFIDDFSISPDGRLLLIGGYSVVANVYGRLKLYSIFTGEELRKVNDDMLCAFSPTGRTIVSLQTNQRYISSPCVISLKNGIVNTIESLSINLGLHFAPDSKNVMSTTLDGLVVWNTKDGNVIGRIPFDSRVERLDYSPEKNCIVLSNNDKFELYELIGEKWFNFPVVTSGYLYLQNEKKWDEVLTYRCPKCGQRSIPNESVLGLIDEYTRELVPDTNTSPCLELPDEAWEEPGLVAECPKCKAKLRFNPFIFYSSRGENDGVNVEETLKIAKLNYSSKKYSDAVGDFTELLTVDSENAEYLAYRGSSYLNLNLLDKALEDLDKCLSIEENGSYYTERGNVHFNMASYVSSIDDYTRAINLNANLAYQGNRM